MADDKIDIGALEKQLKIREQSLALEEKMLEAMELQGKRTKGMADQRRKVAALQKELNKGQSEFLKAEIELEKLGKSRAATMKTMTMLGGAFMTVVGKTQELLKRGSDNTRATADAMGLNVDSAKKLNTEILAQLKGSKQFDTNLQDSVAAANALDSAFGGAQKFTAAQAVDLDIASKKLGISRDAAAGFSKFMFATSGASLETSKNLMAGIKSLSDASGVKFSKVMDDIAKSGDDIAKTFGKSGDEIAIMAVNARKMGFELSDILDMNNALLDVESSIENQMKFNMLTGKNINLDKARALALEGDHEAMMKEVVKQAGDLEGLNQLEIKALNDALGVDILKLKNAKELEKQAAADAEKKAEIAEIEAAIREGQLEEFAAKELDRQNAATAEERRINFENNLADKAAQSLENQKEANNLALILQGIQLAIQGIMFAQAMASSLKAATEKQSLGAAVMALPKLIASGIASMAGAVGKIFMSFASIPFGLGIPLAIAAIAGMYALGQQAASQFTSIQDGMIDPSGGLVVNGPKGSIQLDKQDSIVAGTNLGGGGGKSMNLDPLIRKLDELIAATKGNRQLSVDGYRLNESTHLEKIPSGMV